MSTNWLYFISSDNTVPTKASATNIAKEFSETFPNANLKEYTLCYGVEVNDPIQLSERFKKLKYKDTIQIVFINKETEDISALANSTIQLFKKSLRKKKYRDMSSGEILKDIIKE